MMGDRKIRRRTYGPSEVDGFRDEEEKPVAYCPREKKKKPPEEHRLCEHHQDAEATLEEIVDAAPCDYDEEEDEGE
ncbi:MAG: hypothetical protein ABIK65_04640 [Candidatus Eisenbacteria bacterium]